MTRRRLLPLPLVTEEEASLGERILGWLVALRGLASTTLVWAFKEQPYVFAMAVLGLLRATGTTVQTGTTGVLFSFGHATREIPPGFRPLIPFLQIVQKVPTRSRTLDLPAQRVTTGDGLVYFVDANLVYQVTDARRAVVQIDDLERGMRQVLGLSVQELVRRSDRESLLDRDRIDALLAEAMEPRLSPWGVRVQRAGFMSVRPSTETIRIVQLSKRVDERRRARAVLLDGGIPPSLSVALLGEAPRTITRRERLLARENLSARRRRLRRVVRRVRDEHPAVVRPNQRALERWLLRATDSRSPVAQAWARKALRVTRRPATARRPGDPRQRESNA